MVDVQPPAPPAAAAVNGRKRQRGSPSKRPMPAPAPYEEADPAKLAMAFPTSRMTGDSHSMAIPVAGPSRLAAASNGERDDTASGAPARTKRTIRTSKSKIAPLPAISIHSEAPVRVGHPNASPTSAGSLSPASRSTVSASTLNRRATQWPSLSTAAILVHPPVRPMAEEEQQSHIVSVHEARSRSASEEAIVAQAQPLVPRKRTRSPSLQRPTAARAASIAPPDEAASPPVPSSTAAARLPATSARETPPAPSNEAAAAARPGSPRPVRASPPLPPRQRDATPVDTGTPPEARPAAQTVVSVAELVASWRLLSPSRAASQELPSAHEPRLVASRERSTELVLDRRLMPGADKDTAVDYGAPQAAEGTDGPTALSWPPGVPASALDTPKEPPPVAGQPRELQAPASASSSENASAPVPVPAEPSASARSPERLKIKLRVKAPPAPPPARDKTESPIGLCFTSPFAPPPELPALAKPVPPELLAAFGEVDDGPLDGQLPFGGQAPAPGEQVQSQQEAGAFRAAPLVQADDGPVPPAPAQEDLRASQHAAPAVRPDEKTMLVPSEHDMALDDLEQLHAPSSPPPTVPRKRARSPSLEQARPASPTPVSLEAESSMDVGANGAPRLPDESLSGPASSLAAQATIPRKRTRSPSPKQRALSSPRRSGHSGPMSPPWSPVALPDEMMDLLGLEAGPLPMPVFEPPPEDEDEFNSGVEDEVEQMLAVEPATKGKGKGKAKADDAEPGKKKRRRASAKRKSRAVISDSE
ncbi:hypothetical protein AURDEDRAFT_115999 [Auricularia subglabra TFB-10046 SS5]|nr:hypothetical protein AURDEDRAFT_115999 [Auricularia subglabra TFB-10046 SS5]